MDDAQLLQKCIIKIGEVKNEPVASCDENIDGGFQKRIFVKSELETFETSADGPIGAGEEELQPLVAVFVQPAEEAEEIGEEQEVKTFETAAEGPSEVEEEELQPLVAVFIQPKEEAEENVGEQHMKADANEDPLASCENVMRIGAVKVEKTDAGLSSPGWGPGRREVEDHSDVQWPLEDRIPGNLACAAAMESEHSLKTPTGAKSFQCAMCMRSILETNTTARHVTRSRERRLVCPPCTKIFSVTKNPIIVMPILSCESASTERSRCTTIQDHAEREPQISPDCSMESEHSLQSTPTLAKSFQCAMCMRSILETNTAASHVTRSRERRLVCPPCTKIFSVTKSPLIVMSILDGKPASTKHSCKNIRVHADEKSHVSPDCGKFKKRQNPSKWETNLKCTLFDGDERILTDKKQYECGECEKSFAWKSNLVQHLRVHKDDKLYECGECKKRFRYNSTLISHSLIHSREKPYECGECKKRFRHRASLKNHSLLHTGEKPYECAECRMRFRTKLLHVRHCQKHTDVKSYECEECKKRFRTKSYLLVHMRIHTGEKPYECQDCKKRFRQAYVFLVHTRIHTGEKPYECEVCKKRYSSKSELARHCQIHTGVKPFECGECKKHFRRQSALVIHMRVHTGERPYECGECKMRFKQRSTLHDHIRIHTGEKPYECGECKKRFPRKSCLVQHSRQHRLMA